MDIIYIFVGQAPHRNKSAKALVSEALLGARAYAQVVR